MIKLTLEGLKAEIEAHDNACSDEGLVGRLNNDGSVIANDFYPMMRAVALDGASLCDHVEPSPERRTLPDTRRSMTHKVRIQTEQGSMSVYFTVSFFEDGGIAEVFINAGKIGSTVRGLLNDLARLLSFALQYGVPANDLFERMTGSNYPPQGKTSNPDIAECHSVTDYLFQWLLKLEDPNNG